MKRAKKEKCGSKSTCASSADGRENSLDEFLENQALRDRMSRIRNKLLVMSGKGGVGKSTVAVNLAVELASRGLRVGLLDADFHGPSIAGLLGLEEHKLTGDENGLDPVRFAFARKAVIKVMSIGFLLNRRDEAVIWRGPMKMGAIKQFLRDVDWGELDYLIIDSPPGTGDEPLSVCQILEGLTGAVIVTTPQKIAVDDVRKSITFCRQLKTKVLGVIENMSGLVCPKCGEHIDVFSTGGGELMAREMGVPFLGRIPMDPRVVASGDSGAPIVITAPDSDVSKSYAVLAEPLLIFADHHKENNAKERSTTVNRKIAVPTADGKLCMHFGHCDIFTLFDVSGSGIVESRTVTPPPHEPGVIPKWLNSLGATHIIAGGMGARAQDFFRQFGIEVVVGAPPLPPEEVVRQYLAGTLEAGENVCDH
ncbi:MAG: iron-sulfur cluster carrier protein MrpORP [bacterium]